MRTGPFHPLLAAVLLGAFVGGTPALADGQPDGTASAPPAKAETAPPQPEPAKPALTTLDGLHLKLGNVELKVRGPVIIDAGPGAMGSSRQGK